MTSDSAGRVDSAAGGLTLNPNGSIPQTSPSGSTSVAAPAPGATSIFLPTLGTSVLVPSTSRSTRSPTGSLPTSPFLPTPPEMSPMNQAQPDSILFGRPATDRVTTPLNPARPGSTFVRPVRPGSTGVVIRNPE